MNFQLRHVRSMATISAKVQRMRDSHSIIQQFTNLIMKDGKKANASGALHEALMVLQNARKENPKNSFEAAIEEISPMVKLASRKQGGRSILSPQPLTDRQRYRQGMMWIAEAASKNKGTETFGGRIGTALLGILDGSSAIFQKKMALHKLAVANRSNLISADRKVMKRS